ncbi:MAG: hypothetical protein JWR42_1500 [Marmoricola sp.]|nr:hypothetical protein [Marmoricola sp.]
MSTVSVPSTPPDPFSTLVDDARALLPDAPGGLHEVSAAAGRREQACAGALLVRDTDLPLLRGVGVPLAVLVTGGAGQVSGPAGLCGRLGLHLARLHVVLRDPADLPANARRVVAAVDDARASGALDEEVPVHVEVPDEVGSGGGRGGTPGRSWLAAADEVAAAELALALPLARPWTTAAADPDGATVPAAQVVGWIDAALDRETPFSFLGASGAVGGGPGSGGRWGALNALVATRLVLDGEAEEAVVAGTDSDPVTLLDRSTPDALARARRWCTSVATTEPDAVVAELAGLVGTAGGWVR